MRRLAMLVVPFLLAAGPAWAGDVTVTLTGVKAKGGEIVVGLYKQDPIFRAPDYSATVKVDAAGNATVTIRNVPAGDYVVSAFHDADGDHMLGFAEGKMTEGTAISNAEKLRGAPSFAINKVAVPATGATLTIVMSYPEDRTGW